MFRKYTVTLISIITTLFILSACQGESDGTVTIIDETRPTVSLTPSTRVLGIDSPIQFHFSESIDTTSLKLNGNLATESNGGIWSHTHTDNDTLTISPSANWPTGAGHSLRLDATDLAGNKIPTLSLDYDVYGATIYYVSTNAIDDNSDGLSPLTAKKTIMSAINAATLPPAVVLVDAGTYLVNSDPTIASHIVLSEGVSLYGSYKLWQLQKCIYPAQYQ